MIVHLQLYMEVLLLEYGYSSNTASLVRVVVCILPSVRVDCLEVGDF